MLLVTSSSTSKEELRTLFVDLNIVNTDNQESIRINRLDKVEEVEGQAIIIDKVNQIKEMKRLVKMRWMAIAKLSLVLKNGTIYIHFRSYVNGIA